MIGKNHGSWMDKLLLHYTGSIGSSLLADRFKFWNTQQSPHESVQEWEVKVRQAGSLCSYDALTDVMCRDKPTRVRSRMGSKGQTSWQPLLVRCTDRRNVPRQIRLWAARCDNESRTAKDAFKTEWHS